MKKLPTTAVLVAAVCLARAGEGPVMCEKVYFRQFDVESPACFGPGIVQD
jgi:hypothetical protein